MRNNGNGNNGSNGNNGNSIDREFPANLKPRSFPETVNEFLRCQLGREIHETRQTVKWVGGRSVKQTVPVTIFHLLGYGSTWEAAEEMALQRLGLITPETPSARDSIALFFGRE